MIVISLVVSERGVIDRLRADQIYYSLGAIVISTAYTVEAAKRDQVMLQLEQRQSLDKGEVARQSLETVTAIRPGTLLRNSRGPF